MGCLMKQPFAFYKKIYYNISMKNEISFIVESIKDLKRTQLWLLNFRFWRETSIVVFVRELNKEFHYHTEKTDDGIIVVEG